MSDWDVVQEVLENRYSFPIGKAEAALDRLRKEHDALKAHNAAGVDLLGRLREAEAYKWAWERLYEDGPSGRDVHDRLALERKTMMDTLLAEEMEKLELLAEPGSVAVNSGPDPAVVAAAQKEPREHHHRR